MADDPHENIVNLIQTNPRFAAELLGIADRRDYGDLSITGAERSTNALGSKATTERRADAVTALTLEFSEVDRLVVITEVQNKWSEDKNRRLLGYVARAFEDHAECEVELLMVCGSDQVARKFREGVRINRRWWLTPLTVSPSDLRPITDPNDPGATPERVMLGLMLNPDPEDPEPAIDTVDQVLGTIETGAAKDCVNMLYAVVNRDVLKLLEDRMKTQTRPYHSAWTDELRAEERLHVFREVLIEICDARGLDLTPEQRSTVAECTDLERLHQWRVSAFRASHAEEIFESS
ncbi:hypothetical protein [Glycomyces xiaoerkulensis]|uniref:hypothetical protein n=1 Tax=Glycomyces xiaoerkulensis TaxID=2038139 RepID=UPI0013000BD5|nr:hypothetical protein [Glycomyces xiaoerkulensis]